MTGELWAALGALIFTIFGASVASVTTLFNHKNQILEQMAKDKESTDQELMAIRMSAFEEYKTLRREIGDVASISRKEFGETIVALREKVTQVELWVRDQLTETRHTLNGSMDMRHTIVVEKLEKTDDRVRELEMFAAKRGFVSDA
jgi:hypothetical protein